VIDAVSILKDELESFIFQTLKNAPMDKTGKGRISYVLEVFRSLRCGMYELTIPRA